ncbi:AAA domain-containing protein, partial [Stenotrophomonas indicatrix]|uniref:AAA domain-containing protein n=2 Tax=Pseudomonadati TaxID=3379134 RepID=UPI0013E06DA3
VRHSNANKSFVLHGPPGTGKSQTITNIIADALANDKKVLFVAAKKAALDVVHRRLEKIGLGSFCLELHSNKSKKSDVLRQLEQSLETPKYQSHIDFQEEAQRIDQRKAVLSRYVDALHQSFPIGWSLYDSVSYLDSNHIAINTT